MNDPLQKVAKTSRIVFPVIGAAMLLLGVIRFFASSDYLGLGEDGILGLFFFIVGYAVTPILKHLSDKEEEKLAEQEEHDTGIA